MRKVGYLLGTAAVIGAGISSAPALAQESSGGASAPNTRIIVTARKEAESVLETPVAVTAFSAEELENIGISDLAELSDYSPGFTYETYGIFPGRADNVPRFRAITVNSSDAFRQPASIFVDGIFVSNGVQGVDFNDVERVEVIKGPQSGLYGRATFSGAVNFITRTPGDTLGGNFSLMAATQGEYEASAGIEGPIIGDALKFRVSGRFHDKAGHYDSSLDGGRLGDEQTWSVGGTLFIEPSDRFEAKLRAFYFENDDGPLGVSFTGLDRLNCGPSAFETDDNYPGIVPGQAGPLGGVEAYFCGTVPVIAPNQPSVTPQGVLNALAGLDTPINGSDSARAEKGYGLDRQALRLSAQLSFDLTDSLTFSSLTGWNEEEFNQLRAGEGSTAPPFFALFRRRFEDINQEIRLDGDAFGDRLSWTLGGNYLKFERNRSSLFGSTAGFAFGDGSAVDLDSAETYGIFGRLRFAFSDMIALSAEGRYQEDTIRDDATIFDNDRGLEATFSNFLPRVILEITPSPDTLIYASYSEGNLPGGFNGEFISLSDEDRAKVLAVRPESSETFDEEKLTSYEVGFKQAIGDRSSIQVAAYYADRQDQLSRVLDLIGLDPVTGFDDFVGQTLNVGNSRVIGVEFEGDFVLNDNFSVSTNIAYTDGKLQEFDSSFIDGIFGVDATGEGNEPERFPKWAGSISLQFQDELNSDWDWYIRNDNAYTGKRWASEVNLARIDDGVISNLRIGARSETIRVEAFVTNLFEDDVPVAGVRVTDLGSLPAGVARPSGVSQGLRDKRQFGVRVSGNF